MRTNSLGFSTEALPPKKTGTDCGSIAIVVDEPQGALSGRMFRTNTLCCFLTTALVLSGVGVGVWFAVSELA